MPKVQRHHYGSHWCIHGYANFDNIIFRTENKCSKLTFENGEKIKLFKWLWELLCFEMGKILRKGRLSLQFKNVLRVCSFLFYMMAYGSLIYRHKKNASWKTIYRHSEIIKKVEMLFVLKLKVQYWVGIYWSGWNQTEHILISKYAGQVLVQKVSTITKKHLEFSAMRTF